MEQRVSIPVRVIKPEKEPAQPLAAQDRRQYEEPGKVKGEARPESEERTRSRGAPAPGSDQPPTPAVAKDLLAPEASTVAEIDEWRDRALRLQAEMANYRQRQQRLAREQIQTERKRLLNAFLRVVDDLERVLGAGVTDAEALHRGIELTHRAALQLLQQEGVERIEAVGTPFDPNWHEAIAAVEPRQANVASGTVLQVTEPGYRLDGELLRPAKVIVAA